MSREDTEESKGRQELAGESWRPKAPSSVPLGESRTYEPVSSGNGLPGTFSQPQTDSFPLLVSL